MLICQLHIQDVNLPFHYMPVGALSDWDLMTVEPIWVQSCWRNQFVHSSVFQFCWAHAVSCSYLIGVTSNVVFCCWSFNVSCLSEMLFCIPSSQWPLTSTGIFAQNCCSLDIFLIFQIILCKRWRWLCKKTLVDSDARFELQQDTLTILTGLNALRRCHVIGWIDNYINNRLTGAVNKVPAKFIVYSSYPRGGLIFKHSGFYQTTTAAPHG